MPGSKLILSASAQIFKTAATATEYPADHIEYSFVENLAPEILNLCQTLKIESLHANIEVGVNELERDAQVQQLLQQQQIRVEFYHDRILFPLAVSGISLIKPIRSIVPLRKML